MYALTNVALEIQNPQGLQGWVVANASNLQDGSPAIQCARWAGERLQRVPPPNRSTLEASAFALSGDADLSRNAGDAYANQWYGGVVLGQDLVWLANVVPLAAAGNWNPFYSAGNPTRDVVRNNPGILDPFGVGIDLSSPANLGIMELSVAAYIALIAG